MRRILRFFKLSMGVPPAFGTFHLVAFFLTTIVTACLCIFFRDVDDSTYRRILIVIWIIMFVMEVIKQIVSSYDFTPEGELVWSYNWGSFPLQLCDSPLYLLLPVALMKDGKWRNALSDYLATYIVLGGLATYILISTTFVSTIYFNVQTLTHHGLQIVSGILIAVHNRRRFALRNFLPAIWIFLIAVGIATLYNVVMHALVPDQVINMFYISPYFKKTMPILNEAWHALHPALTILLYIFGVTFFAFVVFLIYYFAFRSSRQKAQGQAA